MVEQHREVVGRLPWRPARTPGVRAGDEQLPCPRDRNVGKPVLAQPLLVAQVVGEPREVIVVDGAQLRKRGRVAAQRIGQRGGVAQPVTGHPVGREDVGRQARHEHCVPLQALRLVNGEDLHRVRRGEHRLIQARAVLPLGLQVGEQPGQGSVRVDVGVRGDRLDEGHQRRPGTVLDRLQFDRQAEYRDHPLHQFGDRIPAVPAQLANSASNSRKRTARLSWYGSGPESAIASAGWCAAASVFATAASARFHVRCSGRPSPDHPGLGQVTRAATEQGEVECRSPTWWRSVAAACSGWRPDRPAR